MIIDADKIISDTVSVFFKSDVQKEKYNSLDQVLDQKAYTDLHPKFLTPLNIKIDCELFLKEINSFSNYFEQWGTEHTHLPRYGLALVNQDGILKSKDPINGSLYEWNNKFPNQPLLETDCRVPTPVMKLSSLMPLNIFNGSWTRSNILKWHKGAEFKPHIDSIIPAPWIRLWGTTDPKNLKIRSFDPITKTMLEEQDVEAGRIYIIDTCLVHDAVSLDNDTYQFFLSVDPQASTIIKDLINA